MIIESQWYTTAAIINIKKKRAVHPLVCNKEENKRVGWVCLRTAHPVIPINTVDMDIGGLDRWLDRYCYRGDGGKNE